MRSPTVKAFSLGIITGSFLTAGLLTFAFPAKADPDNTSVAYAQTYAPAVCSVLDEYPSFDGIIGIGQAILEDGLTSRQAGYVIALSVSEVCPRHTSLLMAFVREYSQAAA